MLTFLHPVVQMKLSIAQRRMDNLAPGDDNDNGMTVVELSHGMKYPTADKFIDKISHLFSSTKNTHFVMDCRFVTGFDFTGLQAWHMLIRLAYTKKKHLIFVNMSHHIRRQLTAIGLEEFHHAPDLESAIQEYSDQINKNDVLDNVRRLKQTISVISSGRGKTGLDFSRQHSRASEQSIQEKPVASKVMMLQVPDRQQSEDVIRVPLPTVKKSASFIFPTEINTDDPTAQEMRLLKLLEPDVMLHSFYRDDIPITGWRFSI